VCVCERERVTEREQYRSTSPSTTLYTHVCIHTCICMHTHLHTCILHAHILTYIQVYLALNIPWEHTFDKRDGGSPFRPRRVANQVLAEGRKEDGDDDGDGDGDGDGDVFARAPSVFERVPSFVKVSSSAGFDLEKGTALRMGQTERGIVRIAKPLAVLICNSENMMRAWSPNPQKSAHLPLQRECNRALTFQNVWQRREFARPPGLRNRREAPRGHAPHPRLPPPANLLEQKRRRSAQAPATRAARVPEGQNK